MARYTVRIIVEAQLRPRKLDAKRDGRAKTLISWKLNQAVRIILLTPVETEIAMSDRKVTRIEQ